MLTVKAAMADILVRNHNTGVEVFDINILFRHL